MVYVFLVFILVLIDQVTKYLVSNSFAEGQTLPLIENFFHITYVKNHGVAFGLFQGKLNIIGILTIVVIIFIIYHILKNSKKMHFLEKLGYILILSGALGNMGDRLFRGFVVDMIDFRGIWKFVFNFADVCINVGVFLMIIDYIFSAKEDKKINK